MIAGADEDTKSVISYENSDLITVKLELKGDSTVKKRHLLLNKENNGKPEEEDISPSIPRNVLEVKNTSNMSLAGSPVIGEKMGRIISPFQPKISAGKSQRNFLSQVVRMPICLCLI